jgi:hypothetical protein
MWKLRVKIDSWSVGVDELIRERNRGLLEAAFLRCPPRRVWLYVKVVKRAHIFYPNGVSAIGFDSELEEKSILGGEDAIANGLTS